MFARRVLILVCLCAMGAGTAWAQDEELTLAVRRTFGYGSGSDIQGNFRLEVSGPDDLAVVTFTLDDTVLATDDTPPFTLDFVTDDHPLGPHTFGASATTSDGRSLTAAPRRFNFVSAEESWRGVAAIIVPIFSIVGLILLVSLGVPMLQVLRGSRSGLPLGAPRTYGVFGGTICPKCGRPFSRHWWAFNLLTAKLDRCDHCGRWSLVQALPRDVLAKAEAAELA